MQGIQELLSRYTRLTPPDMVVRKKLVESIHNKVHIDLDERHVRIVGSVAYCSVDSVLKNVLFIHKDEILQELESALGKRLLKDIQ